MEETVSLGKGMQAGLSIHNLSVSFRIFLYMVYPPSNTEPPIPLFDSCVDRTNFYVVTICSQYCTKSFTKY